MRGKNAYKTATATGRYGKVEVVIPNHRRQAKNFFFVAPEVHRATIEVLGR